MPIEPRATEPIAPADASMNVPTADMPGHGSVPATEVEAGPPPRGMVERSTLDRATLERVLARAATLQTAAGDENEPSDGLTERQLLEVGREVGLSPTYLRQALAEERTRVAVPVEQGFVAHVAGARAATAHRTVPGTPTQVLNALNQIMLGDESFTVKRRFGERMTWEPRRDFWAAFRRLAPGGGRTYDLLRAHEVAATAVPVDEGRTLIRLDADVSHARASRLQGGIAMAAGGLTTGGLLVGLFTVIVPLALAPVIVAAAVPAAIGVAGGVAVARTHRYTLERTQLALEQILDRLEHGDPRRPLL